MNGNKLFFLFAIALGVALCSAGISQAAIITGVTVVQGTDTGSELVVGGLDDGVLAYTDRVHELENIPEALKGSDYVKLQNNARDDSPYEAQVTTSQLSLLYVLLDDRFGDGDGNDPPTGVPTFMSDGSVGLTPFVDTGAQIDIDENADGSINQHFSLFVTLALPGTHSFRDAQNAGRNMYVIVASDTLVVPEPSTLMLAGMGLAACFACVRRRRIA